MTHSSDAYCLHKSMRSNDAERIWVICIPIVPSCFKAFFENNSGFCEPIWTKFFSYTALIASQTFWKKPAFCRIPFEKYGIWKLKNVEKWRHHSHGSPIFYLKSESFRELPAIFVKKTIWTFRIWNLFTLKIISEPEFYDIPPLQTLWRNRVLL
jgi:hypothetical protein